MKITGRDIAMVAATACITLAAGAEAQTQTQTQTFPKLGSAIYDWDKLKVEPTTPGVRREIARGPTGTLDEFRMHATTLNPGSAPHEPHQHLHEEMIVVKEGNIEVMIGAEWKAIGPGSVAFFAPGTMHGIRNASAAKPATYHVLIWRTPATLKE